MFTKLFTINIVANNCFELLRSLITNLSRDVVLSRKVLKSPGESEKKAFSEDETLAERNKNTILAANAVQNFQLIDRFTIDNMINEIDINVI